MAIARWLVPFLLLTGTWASGAASQDSAFTTQQGRTYTQWLYEGATERLWPRFSPALQAHFGGIEGLRGFAERIEAEAGAQDEVLDERVVPWLGSSIYHRAARFARAPGPVWVQWTIAPDGTVQALLVQPAPTPAPSRFLDYRTRTPLRLPFEGSWFVYWGGRSPLETYHAVARDQRFAYDFVVARDGRTHTGDPARNEGYFCFGLPILAPADGTVVAAVDRIADNAPGRMNADQPLGNHVIIDHGNGEHSFLAHLQKGSVAVSPGDQVAAGEVLGRCGNSGRSSEPHLHYHLQTTPDPFAGEGLPAQFLRYEADGRPVARGEPLRGQVVAAGDG